MNKIIQQQLKQVRLADLSNYDPELNTYHIPQCKALTLGVDQCYDITLSPEIYKDEVLRDNWNHGDIPAFLTGKVEVERVVGKMAQISGVGDGNQFWSGWISIEYLSKAQKL